MMYVGEFCLSVSLYVHNKIICECSAIYRVFSIVDYSFEDMFSALFLCQQACHDKQTQQTGN